MVDVITTVGPASESDEVISAHIALGVKIFRFPFSKASPDVHIRRCARAKGIATRSGSEILAMIDLPGGRPRLTNDSPVPISASKEYSIDSSGSGCAADFVLKPQLASNSIASGEEVLIGDGENAFTVSSSVRGLLRGSFRYSGMLRRQRAFSAVRNEQRIDVITAHDKESLRLASSGGFDLLALSFVESARDISDAREWLKSELSWTPKIVAKIETVPGVANSEEIAQASDMVMIGRGDLTLRVRDGQLWHAQRRIISACRERWRYCIVGTGFLESLDCRPWPTSSEIMDVCAALDMGADALLLTVETAIGSRPVEAVEILRTIEGGWSAGVKH